MNMMLIYLFLMTILTQSCTARVVGCIKGENACSGSRMQIRIQGVHVCCLRAAHFSIVNNVCKCVEGVFTALPMAVGGSSILPSFLGPKRRPGTRVISRLFSSSSPGRFRSSVHMTTHHGFGSDMVDWWKRAALSWTNFTRDMVALTEGINQFWANMTFPAFRLATLNPDLSQGSSGHQRVEVKPASGTPRPPSPPPSSPPPPPPRPPVGRRPIDP
ncbi:hypothetical protein ACOMHN_043718 [Nucella lapillus]